MSKPPPEAGEGVSSERSGKAGKFREWLTDANHMAQFVLSVIAPGSLRCRVALVTRLMARCGWRA